MPDTWRGQIGWGLYGFWTNLIYTVGLAAVMTWVYLNTNRSILSAFLMHFTSNFAVNLIYPVSDNVHLIDACLFLLLGAAVCVWMVQRGGKTVALAGLPAE
jgi:membrane protease YdiL (CAAX protease family)